MTKTCEMANKIIVALDAMSREDALELAKQLQGKVWGFKVNDLLIKHGLDIIVELKNFGAVFADPKLHDIPNTVKNSVERLEAAGADLITIHSSGGPAMLRAAVDSTSNAKILAVTVMTSLSSDETNSVYGQNTSDTAITLARIAASSGVDGVVCSSHELSLFSDISALKNLIRIVPGIRPAWHTTSDDQKRTATPTEAVAKGADYLVIGRPITKSDNPTLAISQLFSDYNET